MSENNEVFVVLYEQYSKRPRSINHHYTSVDSAWTDEYKAKRRASLINEPAKRDYEEGTTASVLKVSLDPNVPLAKEGVAISVRESSPKSTALEWTIECLVKDLENYERDYAASKREDYDTDAEFKADIEFYVKAIEDGKVRLEALKEEYAAKLN